MKMCCKATAMRRVALLAEGVDRNCICWFACQSAPSVALLAEGVDRNDTETGYMSEAMPSPSSRRAWIEILFHAVCSGNTGRSPSSRRAWIEMVYTMLFALMLVSSPSSRRAWIEITHSTMH